MTDPSGSRNREYWDATADEYQDTLRIATNDYHFGPLLPGNRELNLLPGDLAGRRCLEIGCGAGQNSLYLAQAGASCVAVDISQRQLDHGLRLSEQLGVQVEWRCLDMDELPEADLGAFDLIHTSSLCFARRPAPLVQWMADHLTPAGQLLLIGMHPLQAGSWVDLEDDLEGVFLTSYFDLPRDEREEQDGHAGAEARFDTIGEMADWIHSAGLVIQRLLEPQAVPIEDLTEHEVEVRVPYDSPAWRDLYPFLKRVPFAVVFLAGR